MAKNLERTFGSKVLSRIRTDDVQRWMDKRIQDKKRGGHPIKPATWWASS